MLDSISTTENPMPGYDALTALPQSDVEYMQKDVSASNSRIYEKYLRMHKVIVGNSGAKQLEDIYEHLQDEFMPQVLLAAGSAAAEAALVRNDVELNDRLQLFDGGLDAWRRAIFNQRYLNEQGNKSVIEHALPYRAALDIASSGLLREIITGRVTMNTTRTVFGDCLAIAQSNIVQIKLAETEKNIDALGEHTGFGYECNALLAFNKRHARKRFMVPSLARADSGYYHKRQTHDLMIINQEWGEILNIIPVEIKSSTSRRDHNRYGALLVRGKMHLSSGGKCRPEDTLMAITRGYEHRSGAQYDGTAENISDKLHDMVRDYCAGNNLGAIVTRSLTSFHEARVVAKKHAGFQVAPLTN